MFTDLAPPVLESVEFVAAPESSNYQLNMTNNYNFARKPADVWFEYDKAKLFAKARELKDFNKPGSPPSSIDRRWLVILLLL